jgi:ADP-ribose pyrophosphatase YjhB (NUDIX family)
MEQPEYCRICVRGIIYKNGTLLAQELKDKHGNPRGFWCTPGGGVDMYEDLHEACRREMIEETGVEPKIGRLLFIQKFSDGTQGPHGESEQLELFFLIENPDDYMEIDLAATSHGEIEIAVCDFIDPKTAPILPAFLRTLDLDDYVNNVRPVYFYDEHRV